MVGTHVLVAHDGDTNRVTVEDGVIIAASDDVFVGIRLDEIAPAMGNVLEVGAAGVKGKHHRNLAKIADEVANSDSRSGKPT